MLDIALEKFQAARAALVDKALVTPLVPYPYEFPIYLKAENLQPSGSFKIRGATYCLSRLTPQQRAKGVIAFSTGNHAQAVALAAQQLGIKATIVMSHDALDFKISATRRYGAEVIMVSLDERVLVTETLAKEKGYYLIPPFDHPDVVTGQGTIGLEILDEMTPAAVFVPVGGGGLIAGIATAIKKSNPSVKIIGVEPELEDDACQSFKSGTLVRGTASSTTIADAVKIPCLGTIPYPLIRTYVDDIITVSEKQIAEATLNIVKKTHLLVEPSGALALAGACIYKPIQGPVVCIASGGNTTLATLCTLN